MTRMNNCNKEHFLVKNSPKKNTKQQSGRKHIWCYCLTWWYFNRHVYIRIVCTWQFVHMSTVIVEWSYSALSHRLPHIEQVYFNSKHVRSFVHYTNYNMLWFVNLDGKQWPTNHLISIRIMEPFYRKSE